MPLPSSFHQTSREYQPGSAESYGDPMLMLVPADVQVWLDKLKLAKPHLFEVNFELGDKLPRGFYKHLLNALLKYYSPDRRQGTPEDWETFTTIKQLRTRELNRPLFALDKLVRDCEITVKDVKHLIQSEKAEWATIRDINIMGELFYHSNGMAHFIAQDMMKQIYLMRVLEIWKAHQAAERIDDMPETLALQAYLDELPSLQFQLNSLSMFSDLPGSMLSLGRQMRQGSSSEASVSSSSTPVPQHDLRAPQPSSSSSTSSSNTSPTSPGSQFIDFLKTSLLGDFAGRFFGDHDKKPPMTPSMAPCHREDVDDQRDDTSDEERGYQP